MLKTGTPSTSYVGRRAVTRPWWAIVGVGALLFGAAVTCILTRQSEKAEWFNTDDPTWLDGYVGKGSYVALQDPRTRALFERSLGDAVNYDSFVQCSLGGVVRRVLAPTEGYLLDGRCDGRTGDTIFIGGSPLVVAVQSHFVAERGPSKLTVVTPGECSSLDAGVLQVLRAWNEENLFTADEKGSCVMPLERATTLCRGDSDVPMAEDRLVGTAVDGVRVEPPLERNYEQLGLPLCSSFAGPADR